MIWNDLSRRTGIKWIVQGLEEMTAKSLNVNNARRHPSRTWRLAPSSIASPPVLVSHAALILAFVLFPVSPLDESSPIVTLRAQRAQQIVEDLRAKLSIAENVQIGIVITDPFVFSVKPTDTQKDNFLLSMELGFLVKLNEDEMRAAVAHELGHVWIFTHFPFLQTERLANDIGGRVVYRGSFEDLYSKLWKYEGKPGVPLEELLGPDTNAKSNATSRPE